MLAAGQARAYVWPGSMDCLAGLLEKEGVARAARTGLWSHDTYRIRAADAPGEMLRLRSSYAIVEGRVAAVSGKSGRHYVNFGEDWRRDFTIVVPPAVARGAPDAAGTLEALVGKTVRVRGWIERRNGPAIEVPSLAVIEMVDQSPQ
jgi:hypothetical protein